MDQENEKKAPDSSLAVVINWKVCIQIPKPCDEHVYVFVSIFKGTDLLQVN